MKKMILALMAVVMSANMMAQDNEGNKRGRQPMNPDEMAQKRTEHMVKAYGLSDEQAAKVLDLNKRLRMPMGPRMGNRGHHPEGKMMQEGRPGMRPDRKADLKGDSLQMGERPKMMKKDGAKVEEGGLMKAPKEMGNRHEEMRKQMEEYDNALKEILTEEQYNADKADQAKRMKEGPRGPRQGQRPAQEKE